MSVQDSTTHIVAALNQVRSEAGLPPIATPAQAEFDAMKKELEETKQELERNKESFKVATFALKEDYDRLEEEKDELEREKDRLGEEKDRLETMYDELLDQITELQDQIAELTAKEEEDPQPTPAVPAPAQPITIRKLQKWVFIQYLLQVDPSKKYYNTFRSKWIKVYILAKHNGGKFYEDVDALNHQSIESLDGMINRLEDLYIQYEFDEILAAIAYLKMAKDEYPNA